jgi:hypothetical protein
VRLQKGSMTDADFPPGCDVREVILTHTIADLGPYIHYNDLATTDRRTGEILWRAGDDPAKRPQNPERPARDPRKPFHTHRGL